jgi:hypothetical protein
MAGWPFRIARAQGQISQSEGEKGVRRGNENPDECMHLAMAAGRRPARRGRGRRTLQLLVHILIDKLKRCAMVRIVGCPA